MSTVGIAGIYEFYLTAETAVNAEPSPVATIRNQKACSRIGRMQRIAPIPNSTEVLAGEDLIIVFLENHQMQVTDSKNLLLIGIEAIRCIRPIREPVPAFLLFRPCLGVFSGLGG